MVEHDEETMLEADHIIDIGPGAGIHGGYVVAQGTAQQIMQCKESITGQYLSGAKRIPVPAHRRSGNGHELVIKKPKANNLKGMDVKIPLGTFTCVTGVSGSGKSSLINEVLYKTLAVRLNGARFPAGEVEAIEGLEHLDKIIAIDQSPIGRTPAPTPPPTRGCSPT